MMSDLRIGEAETNLFRELRNRESVSVIWDLNAFYINHHETTYKLECLADLPVGAKSEYDEVVFCRFSRLDDKVEFLDSEPGFWYKVMASETKLEEVQIIDVVQLFPEEFLIGFEDLSDRQDGVNLMSLGCLMRTKQGILPAFVLPSNFGFSWLEECRFYTEGEVENLLQEEIGKYKLRSI